MDRSVLNMIIIDYNLLKIYTQLLFIVVIIQY